MRDRVPLYPGRVKLVSVSGQENVYDMTRADQPTQQGDPLNKATLLKDATAALFGLGTDAVPDDVLAYVGKYAQHWWRKRKIVASWEVEKTLVSVNNDNRNGYNVTGLNSSTASKLLTVKYSSELDIAEDGEITDLKNPISTVDISINNFLTAGTVLLGKYVRSVFYSGNQDKITENELYYIPPNATLKTNNGTVNKYTYASEMAREDTFKTISVKGDWEYIQSSSRSAYPDSGEQDGYEYQYLGIPFDNAASPHVKSATGSYVGTGKYGSSNKNNAYIGFIPKFFLVYSTYNYPELGVFKCEAMTEVDKGSMFMDVSSSNSISENSARFITDSGGGIRWWSSSNAERQFNRSGQTYYYFALG